MSGTGSGLPCCSQARLVLEHGDELLVLAEVGEQRLDDEQLLEPGQAALAGEVHLAHAAAGETLEELVAAKLFLHGGSARGAERYASTGSGGRPSASVRARRSSSIASMAIPADKVGAEAAAAESESAGRRWTDHV